MAEKARATICRICKESCGILVSDNGRGLEMKGNPEHPISKGFICFRGKHLGEVHNAQNRLTRPLLRRGSGWETISFEDALGILAHNLEKTRKWHGPESVVFFKGESLKHQEIAEYLRHLSHGFGSPNYMTVGSLCHFALQLGFGLTIGGIPHLDPGRSKVAVLWGVNPAVAFPRSWSEIRKCLRDGMKLVVIDPTRSQSAKHADLHLPIRPGSDGFLALAFMKYAVEEASLGPRFPEEGWNDLESYVRGLSYEDLIEKTSIPMSLFREACTLIFNNLPGWSQAGSGIELKPCGVQTIRSIAALQSILDPENRPAVSPAPLAPLPGMDRYPRMAPPIGAEQFPVYSRKGNGGQGMLLTRAILQNDPYPVRAMLVVGANPVLTFPGSSLHRKAFESLDFLAVFDMFMTATARCADLVIPATSVLETLELHDYGQIGQPYLGLVRPVVSDPEGWPAWKLMFELAGALGLGDLFPWKDNEEALRHRLSAANVSFDDLVESPSATVRYTPAGKSGNGWSTPDGKVHYRSDFLEEAGCEPAPVSDSFILPLTTDENYPLWLSTGDRLPYFQHSQFHEIPAHKLAVPEPSLDIHPDAARSLGIQNGDRVLLSTRYGGIEAPAKLDTDLRADCLRLSHGWVEANANELTHSPYFDPISGFPWMRALPARIEKREA
jgi:anaerobic selenocysteine-containing dehydrogenase